MVKIPSLRKPINSNIRKWVVMLNYLVLWLLCMWLATKGVRKQVLIQSFGRWTDQQTDKQIDRPTDRCSDRLIERNFIKNFGIPSYCNFYHHHCLETGFFFWLFVIKNFTKSFQKWIWIGIFILFSLDASLLHTGIPFWKIKKRR